MCKQILAKPVYFVPIFPMFHQPDTKRNQTNPKKIKSGFN